MATVIKTTVQLKQIINTKIHIAIEIVSRIMTEELKSYIGEDFYNKFYDRTYSFLNSPKYNLLSDTSSIIFVDTDVMHYLCGEYGITGEDIAWLVFRGYHGTTDIFREGYFWEDYLEWSNKNVPNLLRTELKNKG